MAEAFFDSLDSAGDLNLFRTESGLSPAHDCMSIHLITDKANSYFSNLLPILKCSAKENRNLLKCQHFPEKEHKLSLDFLPTGNIAFLHGTSP